MGKNKKESMASKLRKTGKYILLIPILFLAMFLVGELIGGDISGVGHMIQLIPVVVFFLLAEKYPFIIGMLLIFIGVWLSVNYALYSGFPIITIFIVDGLLFLPLIISGLFLVFSGKKTT